MTHRIRHTTLAAVALLTLTTVPATAHADVCASAGRRVSVSGCANIADTIGAFVPPPYAYAPIPEDYPPPPPPPPVNVSVCASAGRRISVSGCV